MNKKDIKKDYKNKKKELKKNYKEEKKGLHLEYNEELDTYFSHHLQVNNNPPRRTALEEIGNAVSHGVGALASVLGLILLILKSDTQGKLIGSVVYFIGLFLMFTMSTLYHSFSYGSKVKRIFRRFDYSSIYLLIGATFAPILLIFVGGNVGMIFFIIQWLIIITGITLVSVFGPTKIRVIHFTLYFLLGWSGLLFLPRMVSANLNLFFFILGGGIVYTLGIIPFALNKKCSHFIWHLFVFLGALTQWIGIYLYIY